MSRVYENDADPAGLLFAEVSAMTGENLMAPFLLASRTILAAVDAGTVDPETAGTGVSFGERQLRTVGSSSRMSAMYGRRRGRRKSVSLESMVGSGRNCKC